MSFSKGDDNCIPINDIKRVTFGISDTCKMREKKIWVRTDIRQNAVKEMKASDRKIPSKIKELEKEEAVKQKKILEDKIMSQTAKKSVIPCLQGL